MSQVMETGQPIAWTIVEDVDPHSYRSHWSLVWYRLRRNKAAMLGAAIVIALVLAAIFAPFLAPHDPNQAFDNGLSLDGTPTAPNATFLMGADTLGRDVLSRILYGARISLSIGIVANGLAMLIGVLARMVRGYFAGCVGTLVMRVTDIMMSF